MSRQILWVDSSILNPMDETQEKSSTDGPTSWMG